MLLVALVIASATTVDYSTAARPLGTVLRELSAVVGEEWRATKALHNELLVVRIEGVQRDELRKRVAEAVVGTWVKEGDAWVIRPDEVKLRKRGDSSKRSFSNQLKQKVDEFYKHVKDLSTITEADLAELAADGMDGSSEVGDWVMAHALRQLDCFEIAGLPDGQRFAYSSTSNRFQRQLRASASLLDHALEMQHRFADASARANVEEPEVGTYEHDLRIRAITKWHGPLRVVLIINWQYDELAVRCLVMDRFGKVAERANITFGFSDEPPLTAPETLQSTVPEFSSDSEKFEQFARIGPTPTQSADFDPKFIAKLSKPTVYEPLGFSVSDYLTEIGRRTNWNVVARPYDEMYLGSWGDERSTLGSWFESIQSLTSIDVVLQDDWLVIGPSGYRVRPQIDRKALESFIASGQNRVPTLDDAARYAQVSVDNLLELSYLPPFTGFYPDWTWLRFYGKLPNELRTRLWEKESVIVRELPTDALRYLERIILDTDGILDSENWYDDGYYMPPVTDYLSNGIPADAAIKSKTEGGFCLLQTKPRNYNSRSYARPLDSVAEGVARAQLQGITGTAEFPWRLAPFLVGNIRQMDISVQIGPLIFGDILVDPDVSRRGEPVTGPPLPEEVKASFEEAVARHLKRLRDESGGG